MGVIIDLTLVAIIFACIFTLILFRKSENKVELNIDEQKNIESFCPSDYLKRIIELSDELQHEKEQSDNYRLILWWGINGLRLNADGSYEWTKKEIIKSTTLPSPTGAWRESMVQQTCCTSQYQRLDSMLQCQQSRINELQMQNAMLQLQCAQQQQMQNMIDSIHPQMFRGLYASTPYFLTRGYYGECCQKTPYN